MQVRVNKQIVVPVAVGVASFGVGFAAGYFFHKKRNVAPTEHIVMTMEEKDPDDQLRLDFERVAENQEKIMSKANHPTAKVIEVEEEVTSQVLTLVEPSEEINMVNVFTNEDSDWDYELELANRDPELPYIIHRDEFYENEADDIYDRSSLIYYKGDDILCDDNYVPIYEYLKLTGNLRFGHGSNDPSIVYIRNEPMKAQYEVILDHGYFGVEILGAEIEEQMDQADLKHSHSLHKFRD